jgi:hypothetical protein
LLLPSFEQDASNFPWRTGAELCYRAASERLQRETAESARLRLPTNCWPARGCCARDIRIVLDDFVIGY